MSASNPPISLTIAGSDSSGGAGIQADLKTFSALHVYGASVITALTAQNTQGVQAIHIPPVDFIYEQLRSVFSDLNIQSVKIGMLANVDVIKTVHSALDAFYHGPIVIDPVMVATSGDRLLNEDAQSVLEEVLFPKAVLITPNLSESSCLLKRSLAQNEQDMIEQGQLLKNAKPYDVLLKGGHLKSEKSVDYYFYGHGEYKLFASERISTLNTHGTGCTLSSAIAAYIAKGYEVITAIGLAKQYLSEALAASETLNIGFGAGPVHHLYDFWRDN